MLAMALAAVWEIFENTDFVILHYRAATIALGYRGDSIVNSVGDVLACVLGFLLASRLSARNSAAFAAGLAVTAAWVVHDDASAGKPLINGPSFSDGLSEKAKGVHDSLKKG